MKKLILVLAIGAVTGCKVLKRTPKELSPCEQLGNIELKIESLSEEEKLYYLIENLQKIRDLTTLCDMQKSKGH